MTPSQIQLIERKNALEALNKSLNQVWENPLYAQEIETENN